jgi:hypothetical protein
LNNKYKWEENMMTTLSEEEAREIVREMMSSIKIGIENYGEANIQIAELEKRYDPMRREGGTPDVFCKIAGAAFEQGIATDVGTTKHAEMILRFWSADQEYKPPSSEVCKKRWISIKGISKRIM